MPAQHPNAPNDTRPGQRLQPRSSGQYGYDGREGWLTMDRGVGWSTAAAAVATAMLVVGGACSDDNGRQHLRAVAEAEQAMAENRVDAMDFVAREFDTPGVFGAFDRDRARMIRYVDQVAAFRHRRYHDVLVPPGNFADFLEEPRTLAWLVGALTRTTFGPSDDQPAVVCVGAVPGHLRFTDGDSILVRIDFDRDGSTDVAFRSSSVSCAPGLQVVHHDAGDGYREQWLVALESAEPREETVAWFWRDGRFLGILAEADGRRYGRSLFLPGQQMRGFSER